MAEVADGRPVVEADAIIAGDGTQRRQGVGEPRTRGESDTQPLEVAWSEAWRSADRCAVCHAR